MNIIELAEKYDGGKLTWKRLSNNEWNLNPYAEYEKRTGSILPKGEVYCPVNFIDEPYSHLEISGTIGKAIVKGGARLKPINPGDCIMYGNEGTPYLILIHNVSSYHLSFTLIISY